MISGGDALEERNRIILGTVIDENVLIFVFSRFLHFGAYKPVDFIDVTFLIATRCDDTYSFHGGLTLIVNGNAGSHNIPSPRLPDRVGAGRSCNLDSGTGSKAGSTTD